MRRHVIAVVVGTVLSAALAVSAAPGASAGEGDGRTQAERARAEHQRIVDYWTPERRASAVPRNLSPLPLAKGGRPGGGGGGGGGTDDGTSAVLGAAWNGHENVRRTTGKVFFTLGSTRYVCSGSAVTAPSGRSIVSTAGHCVHEGNGGKFATNWIFYPRWNGAADPKLGEWTATSLSTTRLWATTANGFDDDAGFAVVTDGKGGTLAATVGAEGGSVQGLEFTSPAGAVYTALGYPASKKYKGNTLIYCRGPVSTTRDSNDTLAMNCDMTGGSSGGPWLHSIDTASGVGTQASLNSYGYASLTNVMFGPIFDEDEKAAYDAASSGSCAGGAASGGNCVIDDAA